MTKSNCKYNSEIFREYDIRGKYQTDFDESFAYALGKGFVQFCKDQTKTSDIKLALGRDARHSSLPLLNAMAKGMSDAGADVLDLGLITSPVCYFSCYQVDGLTGSIMITGSHNPPEYNGFKISLREGTLTSDKIKSLEKYVLGIDESALGGSIQTYDIITPYIARISEEFNLKDIPFVVDCGNGAAGSVARKVYEAAGLSPEILFEKPDGDFPNHHPDPTLEENLVDLKKAVLESKSAFGVGYDGDADRIVIVTETGKTVYADELMSIYAKSVLADHPGAEIVADVKCSQEYFKLLEKWGAKPIMWMTGHSLIKQKVKELKSPFGGEFSGHIFFADRFYGFDDALYCSLRLVEILEKSGATVSDLLSEFPTTFSTAELRIEVGEKEKYELVEKYRNAIKDKCVSLNEIDGVRAHFEDGWALVRVSNTQPSVTLRFEAQSEQNLNEIKNQAFSILGL
ncbi:MAG: phosphomannomutase/phosphoglucomutase [Bdellovibrionales bacterium]